MEAGGGWLRVKIIGAGSVGAHLAHAARQLGYEVFVTDHDSRAIHRFRDELYPSRYGAFDPNIQLRMIQEPTGGFDLICIGTPPDTHLALLHNAMKEHPRAILVEKPLCPATLKGAQATWEATRHTPIGIFVGYNHTVSRSIQYVENLLRMRGRFGYPISLDVSWQEHWQGIFDAHPWLRGPQDSYLGYWMRGGGALGEHSHGLAMAQHLAHVVGAGRIRTVSASIEWVRDGVVDYESMVAATLTTETGLRISLQQDVVTTPPQKKARLTMQHGTIDWIGNADPYHDAVLTVDPLGETRTLIPKRRTDDFVDELLFIQRWIHHPEPITTLGLDRGFETALVMHAIHRVAYNAHPTTSRVVPDLTIDYRWGCRPLCVYEPVWWQRAWRRLMR